MNRGGLAILVLGAALLAGAGCSKKSKPEEESFECKPTELHRGEKLIVRMPLPHGEDLMVTDPDGRLLYIAVYKDGAGKRPGLDPAIDPFAFRRMDILETSPAEAQGAPQQGGARQPVFTKPGRYQVVLGDNLGTQYAMVQGQCEIRYVDSEGPH